MTNTLPSTTDMSEYWDSFDAYSDIWTAAVKVPHVGTFVVYKEKQYVVLKTTTYQEVEGDLRDLRFGAKFTTLCTLLEVDNEGDDVGSEHLTGIPARELKAI